MILISFLLSSLMVSCRAHSIEKLNIASSFEREGWAWPWVMG